MSLRTSANRYARALFDVALQESDVARVDRDLTAVMEVVNQCGDELAAVSRHEVPAAVRCGVIDTIAARLDVSAPVQKLLLLLADGRRLDLLPELAAAYHARLLDQQNVVRAEVTSAAPLTPERTASLSAALAKVTGKQVDVSVSVDPALLGGLVARIGSTVYDGSVRTQLRKLRQALVE